MERFRAVDRDKPGFMFWFYFHMPPRNPPGRINGIIYRAADGTSAIIRINFCPWCGANLESNPVATFGLTPGHTDPADL